MTFPWRKLFQSIQDDIEGVGNAVFGDRAERLLDEEIREVDELLHHSRSEHAAAKARRITAQQQVQQLKAGIREAEAVVEACLKRRRTTAARDHAAEVVRLHARLADMNADTSEVESQEARLLQLQAQLEHRLRRLKHQLDTHRATASLQRAQAAVARRQPGDAPYPEPAPVSAKRMRQSTTTSANVVPPGRDGLDDRMAQADPVADVIQRISKRIKPRTTANTPHTEQGHRR